MAMHDWLHHYPRVQALLQQEGDVLDYDVDGAESAGAGPLGPLGIPMPQPFAGLQPLAAVLLLLREGRGPTWHGVPVCVVVGARAWGAVFRDPRRASPDPPMACWLHGILLRCLPAFPPDLWALHLADPPRWATADRRTPFRHEVEMPPLPSHAVVLLGLETLTARTCETPPLAPICRCGAYLLHWQD